MGRVGTYSSVIVALSVLAGLLLLGTGCASSGTADDPVKRAAEPAATKNVAKERAQTKRTKDEHAEAESKDEKKAPEEAGEEQGATEKKAAKKANEKEAAEQAEKKAAERAAAGRATAEQYATEQAAAKQYAAEQAAPEQAVAQQAVTQPVAPQPAAAAPAAPSGTDLYLTVPKMGLYDAYVANTTDPVAMDNGAIKLPETGFPWEPGANTYIAGHVLGYEGTGSYKQFAELPNMAVGDEVLLRDANGTTYTYRVSETMTVTPYDTYVTAPIPGRTTVTLQTCVNPPAYDQRLVVRADLVG